ncbi:MAG: hypothetical protein RL398_3622, partial [Planctomycetota bacterium]
VGLGFLTRELAQRAGRVVGIEIDERLYEIAKHDLAAAANVELVFGDALAGPGRSLRPEIDAAGAAAVAAGGQFLVVANLPYSVSGPLLAELSCLANLPQRAVLLVQKEMAQRVAAPHGSADFGGLSVVAQSVFGVRILRDVSPQVFRPRPKVVSAVLLLERRTQGPLVGADAAARRAFAAFVRRLFQQRRKVLRHTLPAAAEEIGRRVAGDVPSEMLGLRAEQLDPGAVVALWQSLQPSS